MRTTEITGTKGRLEINILDRSLVHIAIDGTKIMDKYFGGKHEDDYVEEMRLFISAIHGESQVPCDGEEALAVLKEIIVLRELANLPAKR